VLLLLPLTTNVMTVMIIHDVAEWLFEAYRTQWLAMLRVDSGTDLGCVSYLPAALLLLIVICCIL